MRTFQIGDTVVKPGLGLCKIKGVQKMSLNGEECELYVLQAGEVKVMVPLSAAHTGGLRAIMDPELAEQVLGAIAEPIYLEEDQDETPQLYAIDIDQARDQVKRRDPLGLAEIIRRLFNKAKVQDLSKYEQEIYSQSMNMLGDEIAHLEHTTRMKITHRIRTLLNEARKQRKSKFESPLGPRG
ncbi:MAG TPA: CarD family transcriptional regulator [bacterium]|nr:CarD family transcriptional regulator [bacterium]HQL63654.1 CarD family transcriptional regulator [bacterium]